MHAARRGVGVACLGQGVVAAVEVLAVLQLLGEHRGRVGDLAVELVQAGFLRREAFEVDCSCHCVLDGGE